MSNTPLSSNGDTPVFDNLTGEIFPSLRDSYDLRQLDLEGYHVVQPIDISTIISRSVYDQIVSDKIGRKRYRLWVSPLLLDEVVSKDLSIPALSIFCLLGQKVGYNNMVYSSTKELSMESSYVRQTVSNAIGELLEKGFIREPNSRLEKSGDRFFLVNPVYFFLGYYPYRDVLLRDWIKL